MLARLLFCQRGKGGEEGKGGVKPILKETFLSHKQKASERTSTMDAYVEMNTKGKMPILGLGTWQVRITKEWERRMWTVLATEMMVEVGGGRA